MTLSIITLCGKTITQTNKFRDNCMDAMWYWPIENGSNSHITWLRGFYFEVFEIGYEEDTYLQDGSRLCSQLTTNVLVG